MLSRNKVIIALVPFFATTFGVIIFLLFFNYGDITFHGEAPFQVMYNNQTIDAVSGEIHFRTQANSEQSFLVKKTGYDDQTISKTLSVWGNEQVPLTFVYTPTIESTTYAKPITYPSRSDIADNQATDLITSTIVPAKVDIPVNFTRVVWAKDGTRACLFNSKDTEVLPRMWEMNDGKVTLSKLPDKTFECFSTDEGLISVQMQDGTLFVDGKVSPIQLPENFFVTASPSSTYILMSTFQSGTGSGTSLITLMDREKKTSTELIIKNLKEFPRFGGSNTFAIHTDGKVTVYPPDTEAFDINKNIDIRTLVYSEETNTVYYPDSIVMPEEPKLENIFAVFQPPKKAQGIIAYNVATKTEKLIYSFPDIEQTVFWGKIYRSQKQLVFLTGEQGSTKLQIITAP